MGMSDDEWEDGEVLEEGKEREAPPPRPLSNSAASSASDEASRGSVAPVKAEKQAGEGANRPTGQPNAADAAKPWPPLPLGAPPPLPAHRSPSFQPISSANGSYAHRNGGANHSYHRQHQQQPYRQGGGAQGHAAGNYHAQNTSGAPHYEQDDRAYSAELVLKYPRQQPRSRVLLDFAAWMESARMRRRLTVDDVQSLLLNVLKATSSSSKSASTAAESDSEKEEGEEEGDVLIDQRVEEEQDDDDDRIVSEFLLPSLFPGAPLPRRVCLVLLGGLHPAVVQKFRATLPFFDACTSVPVSLTKREHARRIESPLAELLYKFPKPRVDSRSLPIEEMFYAHELTFMMEHSFGYVDELLLAPDGSFARRSQSTAGGNWALNGEMLYLKWRRAVGTASAPNSNDWKSGVDMMEMVGIDTSSDPSAAAAVAVAATHDQQNDGDDDEEDENYTLDVLVSEDETLHYFSTNALLDDMYARDVPEHLQAKKRKRDADGAGEGEKKRSIRLSLVKATAVDVPRTPDGAVILPRHVSKKKAGDAEQQNKKPRLSDDNDDKTTDDTSESKDKATPATDDAQPSTQKATLSPEERAALEYYVLSRAELQQHGYPVDVDAEQRRLASSHSLFPNERYQQTRARPADHQEGQETLCALALDCEMCETSLGMELTRVTAVDVSGKVVYDALVKPPREIVNYHTQFSGISEETLRDTKRTLTDVQNELLSTLLFEDTVLVGHSLTSDLRALRLVHFRVADTAILFPHQRGFPFRTSLKFLTKTYLNREIQSFEIEGHDSAEDAIAAMDLLVLKIRRGPWFGIPDMMATTAATSTSGSGAGGGSASDGGAFDSLLAKTRTLDKRVAMLHLESSGLDDDKYGDEEPRKTARKPWDLFASGDLRAVAHSPFRHALSLHRQRQRGLESDQKPSPEPLAVAEECALWSSLRNCIKNAFTAEKEASNVADVCWVEIDAPTTVNEPASGADTADTTTPATIQQQHEDFVGHHDAWMARQHAHCRKVDAFLTSLTGLGKKKSNSQAKGALPPGTLVMALPQGDLALLRYLKGLRTRSKWRDNDQEGGGDDGKSGERWSNEELHAAVGDAFRGAMDSCLFLMQTQ